MAQKWKCFACQRRQQLQGQQRLVDQTLQQAALVEQRSKDCMPSEKAPTGSKDKQKDEATMKPR
ncbi:uncharacterized protein DS421_17g589050 [Arachis hypogaea]|nr:uncharacterized protein DS421_17g589050 [Arachis hypogaea]